ncbi:MAG: bifunctional metallophosphatase/5'-nucleotidase [Chloroflexi bacterium]|nr:bifunctional metallophosphatase/5'-nucleotidase [Chloroflexota bacterium]
MKTTILFRKLAVFVLVAVILVLGFAPSLSAQDQVSLTILHTNDLHGIMLPFEEENGEVVGGFSRIATLVQQVRQEEENVLLVDAGDTIMEDQHLMANYFRGEPVVRLMNQIGYDLAVPGNHDFEFGLDVLAQRISEADATYLAANIVAAEDADQAALELISQIEPYAILSVSGVRIGFLGLTQPLHEFPGIQIKDTVQVAQEYVPQIREEADVVVVITHQKLARDYEIVDQVEGIDILIAAHVHDVVFEHGLMRNGTLIAKTSCWGREVGRVDLTVEKGPDGFHLKDAQASLLHVTSDVAEDEEINRIIEPYLNQTRRYQVYLVSGVVCLFLVIIAVLVILMRRSSRDSQASPD